jgi:Iap family predicted aminopeptidase
MDGGSMMNLKYVKKMKDEPKEKQEIPVDYPENWDMICEVLDTKKRQTNKNLDWYAAEQALEEAGVPNKTEALLILRAKKMIEEKKPKIEEE